MATEVLVVNPAYPESLAIKKAVSLLKAGRLVVFPTETVYGLAADAFNSEAVAKVFEAKGRTFSKPLAVCISSLSDLDFLVEEIPDFAKELVKHYLPGPLTLILRKKKGVPVFTTRTDLSKPDEETIAIRYPSNKIFLSIINSIKCPLVLTSANISGGKSPTTFDELYAEMKGKVDLIIDGGRTELRIESTVINTTVSPPRILREGAISARELEDFYKKWESQIRK
ncbi:MAG: L-threonylcarbamoyladenylate synthase [Candidatus Subteraquimicrobiales bacterium]|nr:L-threonylcarbamoyladenylate synthase [Candidatus Subteraquimicrobiales bacterium]